MRRIHYFLILILVGLTWYTPSYAQDGLIADEPDTAAFIEANFLLQDTYNAVHCVAQNGDCPSEIDMAVPCLTANCNLSLETYVASTTHTTIQAASESAIAGGLIIIMPGRYRGVQVEETGGADGAYIHFLGWGESGSVVVDAAADPSKSFLRHHFYFIDTHHYIIQNIAFENAEDGAGIFFSGYFSYTGHFSHHMIVLDVYSHDNYEWGMHTTATNYMLIQDSVFTNSADEHGLYISGSGDNIVVRRNVFQGNTSSGLQINADPQTAALEIFYWLDNTTGDTCGWSEEDADFYGAAVWDDLKACYDEQGLPDLGEFFEDGISENIIVEQNIITGNGEGGAAGINLASVRNTTIRNNLIYGNGAAGIACWDNGYTEENELASSEFGCQNVQILNNTLVDETGNRGALILNQDARNLVVYNNIIVRDRYDTFEVIDRSGTGLQSGHNYYFALNLENSEGMVAFDTDADSGSITGFSVDEALANFVNPNFEPWIVPVDGWYSLNPDRPDYHLNGDSVLVEAGHTDYISVLDAFGEIRMDSAIGAFD